jgi:hypothetical protein
VRFDVLLRFADHVLSHEIITPGVDWHSEKDATYYIFVHSNSTQAGDFALVVYAGNDFCINAEPFQAGDFVTGATAGSTIDAVEECGDAPVATAPGVWFELAGQVSIYKNMMEMLCTFSILYFPDSVHSFNVL